MARLLLIQSLFVEQFGVMTLSAVAKKHGHDVALAVGTDAHMLEKAQRFRPDVVGFSVLTGYQKRYLTLSRELKRTIDPMPLVIFGGPHANFFPEIILEDGVDLVCRGEGEGALLDVLDVIGSGRRDFDSIENLVLKKDGRPVINPLRPLVDLDSLPFPDREIYRDYPMIHESKMVTFIASRGCPFDCTFCFNKDMVNMVEGLGSWVRFRSVDNLMNEIEQVLAGRSEVEYIDFHDDTFILKKKWLLNFLQVYSRKIAVPFTCQIRADLLTGEIATALKEAGCCRVSFGLESGDERLRNLLLKKKLTDEQIRNAALTLNKSGIPFFTTNMMGLPGERLEEAIKTLKLNLEIGTKCAWISLFQPFPGTELAQYCLENGYLDKAISTDEPVDTHTTSLLRQPDIDKIVRLQKFVYLIVRFPFLLPAVLKMTSYDFPRIYYYVHRISYLVLYYRHAYQLSWMETVRHAWLAWKHYR